MRTSLQSRKSLSKVLVAWRRERHLCAQHCEADQQFRFAVSFAARIASFLRPGKLYFISLVNFVHHGGPRINSHLRERNHLYAR